MMFDAYVFNSYDNTAARAQYNACTCTCRADSYWWEVVLRFRAVIVASIPAMVTSNGVAAAFLAALIVSCVSWFAIERQPFAFLRNNNVNKVVDLTFILLLLGGVCITASASEFTVHAVSAIVIGALAVALLCTVHAVVYEMLYYHNEKLRQRAWGSTLLNSAFMVYFFSTDRSYLQDFLEGKAQIGNFKHFNDFFSACCTACACVRVCVCVCVYVCAYVLCGYVCEQIVHSIVVSPANFFFVPCAFLHDHSHYLTFPAYFEQSLIPKKFHRDLLAADALALPPKRGLSFYVTKNTSYTADDSERKCRTVREQEQRLLKELMKKHQSHSPLA